MTWSLVGLRAAFPHQIPALSQSEKEGGAAWAPLLPTRPLLGTQWLKHAAFHDGVRGGCLGTEDIIWADSALRVSGMALVFLEGSPFTKARNVCVVVGLGILAEPHPPAALCFLGLAFLHHRLQSGQVLAGTVVPPQP